MTSPAGGPEHNDRDPETKLPADWIGAVETAMSAAGLTPN
jgi:hypothetical protein